MLNCCPTRICNIQYSTSSTPTFNDFFSFLWVVPLLHFQFGGKLYVRFICSACANSKCCNVNFSPVSSVYSNWLTSCKKCTCVALALADSNLLVRAEVGSLPRTRNRFFNIRQSEFATAKNNKHLSKFVIFFARKGTLRINEEKTGSESTDDTF